MSSLIYNIFLLMLNLTQLKNQNRIIQFFIEAMNSMQQKVTLSLIKPDEDRKHVLDIATSRYFFGRLALEGNLVDLDDEFFKLIRNAVQMLSVVLENRELEKLLQQKNIKMEKEISRHLAALQRSEERYRKLYSAISCGVLVCNYEGKYIHANQAACNILGLSIDQLLGLSSTDSIWQAIYEDGSEYPGELHPEMITLRTGKPVRNAVMGLYSKNNEKLRWILINSQPIFYDQGLMEVVISFIDITGLKLAEEALYAETERLSVTLRSIGDGVITTDTEGKILLINRVAEELTGWKQEEVKGRLFDQVVQIINERTRESCENPVTRVLNTRNIISFDKHTLLIAKNGSEKVISKSGAPIFDKAGIVIGVVLVIRDVTEVTRYEQEALRAGKLESLSILAGGIAHDFNNILTAMVGNTSLAKLYALDDPRLMEVIAEIEKASLRAKDLTQQLLTFARGGSPVKKTATITELLRETSAFALRGSNVNCRYSMAEDLWPVDIDRGQISQVISNLIINAQQAMPDGGTIQVTCVNEVILEEEKLSLPAGRYIKITIKDDGIGIPRLYQEKIFDPYFTTKQKGSGLGLATSYSIIKNHDGYIGVESELGEGTTFFIYLPASSAQIETVEEDCQLVRGSGKILVMDDEKMVRNVLGKMLKYLGYEVKNAESGLQMLELYQAALQAGQPFDAAIMDLTIPGGMGGKEAVQKLLELDPAIKAIVSSGYSNDPVLANYKEFGFSGVILKPYKIEELSRVLGQLISV